MGTIVLKMTAEQISTLQKVLASYATATKNPYASFSAKVDGVPPLRKLLFIWLLRISYITRTYLKLTRCTLTSRMYIPLHRKFREVQIPNLEETF